MNKKDWFWLIFTIIAIIVVIVVLVAVLVPIIQQYRFEQWQKYVDYLKK